ncbi:MAG: type II toxin-antitoxin system VapC family toxin [Candidatus Bathyarchaeota archaeon]|nr:type II toxin-antitoxin system VapC family toxin [Candidatus Bathyarchaeota archaeon]
MAMRRFVDTNIFIYSIIDHPIFVTTAENILRRIEDGEQALTSTLVQCELAWVLEAMGRQGDIKPALEKIMSYGSLEVVEVSSDDLLVGAFNMAVEKVDFNDGVNLAVMRRLGINEVYSNDRKHLGKIEDLKLIFR